MMDVDADGDMFLGGRMLPFIFNSLMTDTR